MKISKKTTKIRWEFGSISEIVEFCLIMQKLLRARELASFPLAFLRVCVPPWGKNSFGVEIRIAASDRANIKCFHEHRSRDANQQSNRTLGSRSRPQPQIRRRFV